MRAQGGVISIGHHHGKPQGCTNECTASSNTEECGVSHRVKLGENGIKSKCIPFLIPVASAVTPKLLMHIPR